jgi:hypothetical protein
MPDNISNSTQVDIMAIAMNETMSKPEPTMPPPLYNFQISELLTNNAPFKYHFRHVVEIHDQLRRKSKQKGQKAEKKTLKEILKEVKTEAVGTIPFKIQANGTYKGPAYVTISCVEAECGNCDNCKNKKFKECSARKNAHPHVVTGEGNDDPNGIKFYRSINIENLGQEFTFKIGIMSTKRNDMKQVLELQEESFDGNLFLKFDPDKEIDLHRVKLCVQFSVANPRNNGFKLPCVQPLYSSTIYNKHNSAYKKPEIKNLYSDNRSPMDGGKDIMITGNIPANGINVSSNASENRESEESNILQVCFDGLTGPDNLPYEICIADPKPEIFQSCGLAFKTPVIPKEFQSSSEIKANIFLRKSYPCGRKDESNKLPFIFEAPKIPVFEAPKELLEIMEWNGDVVENQVQVIASPAPSHAVTLVQNPAGESYPMGSTQEFSQVNSHADGPSVENYGNVVENQVQVIAPPTHTVTLVQNPEGESYRMGLPQDFSHVNSLADCPRNVVDNQVQEVQVTAAPQELSLSKNIELLSKNMDQAPSTEFVINFALDADDPIVENYNEKFPSQIFEDLQPVVLPTPNSQMAKILAQTSNGGLVDLLCNFQQKQEENASKTCNEYDASPPGKEIAGRKRRPQNPVKPDGQLHSNVENTSKGGKKASNKGQEEVEDFKLLSDRTLKILTLI